MGAAPPRSSSTSAESARFIFLGRSPAYRRHAAIGSDLDGGYGTEQCPHDLDTIADLQKLSGLLEQKGFTQEDIAAVLHGNWVRFFRESWS